MEIRTLEKIINFDILNDAALCTQVKWSGSVPRKDYPMMLVDSSKNIIGTIGGGELEHTTINLARDIIKTSDIVLKTFDLTNEDVNKSDSICGGSTTILIEPYSMEIRELFKSILTDKSNITNVLITKISLQNGIAVYRTKNNKKLNLGLPKKIVNVIDDVTEQNKSKSITYNDEIFLIQNIENPPILHIFGAGHVGKAVADLAHFIELDTKIYDERKDLANSERFPFALQINNKDISALAKKANIAPRDYVLVATRGHRNDFELMRWLLKLEIDYLSLMSSNKKWKLLSDALVNDGIELKQINNVHSPVGLDIGSETVPEIAVSVISEIVNYYRNGSKSTISLSKNHE